MRTTLDLPEGLMKEAQGWLGFKSKTDTVVAALKMLVRNERIEDLRKLMDEIEIEDHSDIWRSR